jgi:hypothetical protein
MQRIKHSSLAEGTCNDDHISISGRLRRFSTSQRADICMHAGKIVIVNKKDEGDVEGTRSMCRELGRKLQCEEVANTKLMRSSSSTLDKIEFCGAFSEWNFDMLVAGQAA